MSKASDRLALSYNMQKLVLASASPVRQRLLQDAGIEIEVIQATVDEAAIRAALLQGNTTVEPCDVAEILARAKAEDVALRRDTAHIVAADQVLCCNGHLFEKPKDLGEARHHLLALSGRVHTLHSAVVLAANGQVVWSYADTARLWVRSISSEFVERYLARVGARVFASVGCYELERDGAHLIEKIEGDYFTVLGLPMFPLLEALRSHNIIES